MANRARTTGDDRPGRTSTTVDQPREVVRRRRASAAPRHREPESPWRGRGFATAADVCSLLSSGCASTIQYCMLGRIVDRQAPSTHMENHGRPDPHTTRVHGSSRPGRAGRPGTRRGAGRPARKDPRGHPRRLLPPVRRAGRPFSTRCSTPGNTAAPTRCWTGSSARAATPGTRSRKAGMLTFSEDTAAHRPGGARLGAPRHGGGRRLRRVDNRQHGLPARADRRRSATTPTTWKPARCWPSRWPSATTSSPPTTAARSRAQVLRTGDARCLLTAIDRRQLG